MALFVLSSKDGWVNIMYTGLDAVGVDQQPRENFNEWRLLYFISFLLLVAFFVLNMFVGVVVENFHRCREEQEKEERARRAEKRARKLEKRRRSRTLFSTLNNYETPSDSPSPLHVLSHEYPFDTSDMIATEHVHSRAQSQMLLDLFQSSKFRYYVDGRNHFKSGRVFLFLYFMSFGVDKLFPQH